MNRLQILDSISIQLANIPCQEVEDKVAFTLVVSVTEDKAGIIKDLSAEKIIVASPKYRDFTIKEYFGNLRNDLKEVAVQYHPDLVSVLHEVGHLNTLMGVNYRKYKRDLAKISNKKNIYRLYRELLPELLADEWAVNWLKENKEMAKEISDLLYEVE